MLLDVLTFYQERIANEGYLRTATERRSVLDLVRLVGYVPSPGVAASVYLAYTLDATSGPVEIPAGARAQSIPGPGELPQSFETSEPLQAHAAWNNLKPRMTQPQKITTNGSALDKDTIYFDGTATNLKANDPLLFVFDGRTTILRHVKTVEVQFDEKRTRVRLQEAPFSSGSGGTGDSSGSNGEGSGAGLAPLLRLVKPLSLPPSLQPANGLRLNRSSHQAFEAPGDTLPQLLTVFQPRIAETAYRAWANAAVTPPVTVEVYVLRVTASLFGHNAPRKIDSVVRGRVSTSEWLIIEGEEGNRVEHEEMNVVYLDASYDKILPDSWIVVDTSLVDREQTQLLRPQPNEPDEPVLFARARNSNAAISRAEYGISGKTTRLELADPARPARDKTWIRLGPDSVPSANDFQIIRRTVVYAQSEPLTLAEEPFAPDAQGNPQDVKGDQIELGALYDGLQSGRRVIVSGERPDIPGTTSVRASELVMLTGVKQGFDPNLPGDQVHTTLTLANTLAYTYKRDTVTIYGNVIKATHGETRNEVLGSGDGSKTLQAFTLKQPPLTYVSAPTPAGVTSTLHVRVNDVEWHETDSLAGLGPNDRTFITHTDDDANTTVVFGNGSQGARVPTGSENITSVYRNGIGKSGNVKAEQISLLATRPLGVTAVINPLRASGGADKESRDQARRHTPLAVMALDRLVSTEDYAAFARTFAGIGKASAVRLTDGQRQLVHVTIAGADDIPINPTSDLYHNLRRAVRKLLALIISAKVHVLPDYQWESVARDIRRALLDAFSFERRELGQSVFLSEVISVMQQVTGVAYVDVDVLESLSETEITDADKLKTKLEQLQKAVKPADYIGAEWAHVGADKRILPAQLAYLTPDVPDTLILNEVQP